MSSPSGGRPPHRHLHSAPPSHLTPSNPHTSAAWCLQSLRARLPLPCGPSPAPLQDGRGAPRDSEALSASPILGPRAPGPTIPGQGEDGAAACGSEKPPLNLSLPHCLGWDKSLVCPGKCCVQGQKGQDAATGSGGRRAGVRAGAVLKSSSARSGGSPRPCLTHTQSVCSRKTRQKPPRPQIETARCGRHQPSGLSPACLRVSAPRPSGGAPGRALGGGRGSSCRDRPKFRAKSTR